MEETTGQKLLIKNLVEDDKFRESFKNEYEKDPDKTLKQYGMNPLSYDRWVYRVVVLSLGAVVILCVIFAFNLASGQTAKDTPQILVAIGSAAVGALAGLLAPSPRDK